jgi:thioredoxin reductase
LTQINFIFKSETALTTCLYPMLQLSRRIFMSLQTAMTNFNQPESQSAQVAHEAHALFSAFTSGVTSEAVKPVQGAKQLLGQQVDLEGKPVDQSSTEKALNSVGGLVTNAALFYGISTALRFAKLPVLAPIAAGCLIGLLEPVKSGRNVDHLANGVRGGVIMGLMEKLPNILKERGFSGDFIGNLKNVALTGAVAGGVDTQLTSLTNKHHFATLGETSSASASWALTGTAFHVASLKIGDGFKAISCQQPHVVLLGTANDGGEPVREFLSSMEPFGVRARMIDVKKYPGVSKMLEQGEQLPVAIFPDGSRVSGDIGKLSEKLGLHTQPTANHYRVLVVGAGPAGIQSAINASSELPEESQKVAVVADIMGGQARFTSSVKNFLGFPEITGQDLMTRGINGAQARGTELISNRVNSIDFDGTTHNVTLRDGTHVTADSVVLATGMGYNQLKVPGIERLSMKGVYTLADASVSSNAKGKNIFLVGAGNSAGQAAINFSKYAREVHLVVRGPDLQKSMSEYLIKEVEKAPNISVHLNTEIEEVAGKNHLEQIIAKTKVPGAGVGPGSESGPGSEAGAGAGAETSATTRAYKADGLYAYIGGKPNTSFLRESNIRLNDKGFIMTGDAVEHSGGLASSARPPLPYETSMPGVFAIGDVNAQNMQKRIISAAGEGGKVIGSLHSYLANIPVTEPTLNPGSLNPRLNSMFAIKLPTLGAAVLTRLNTGLEDVIKLDAKNDTGKAPTTVASSAQ